MPSSAQDQPDTIIFIKFCKMKGMIPGNHVGESGKSVRREGKGCNPFHGYAKSRFAEN
jgi:hypothetical protein